MIKHPLSLEGDKWLDEIEETVQKFLTPEKARVVRVLRADFECTWRSVAARVFYIYPDSGVVDGHQLYGEALCRLSALLLNEDPEDEPWN